ncbi:hypothetical protein [Natrinema versiforme]|uniref:Uncharacterized protein n=1 Tax=Natrinema versiforme JCM 10478 TaxID=1227496 RepID=L9XWU0_9EURY|nr:hypothetical protein [Natrinema versiforme]ELY65896.1 hypothetical protein C489_13583 [Natrinema versiforme JCM 10478]
MTRRRATLCVLVLVVVLCGLTATVAADESAVETAIEETNGADTATSLAEQTLPLAAGGALLGLGLGAAVASGITYWYKNREIGGRLQ